MVVKTVGQADKQGGAWVVPERQSCQLPELPELSLLLLFIPKVATDIGHRHRRDQPGKIFPVNPAHEYIHSTKSYATVLSIPDPVDLAIVIVPKEYVEQVVEDFLEDRPE